MPPSRRKATSSVRKVGRKVGGAAKRAAGAITVTPKGGGRRAVKKAVGAVKSDLAKGRQRRAGKLWATGVKADVLAKRNQRKTQKATRSRVAARKRKQSGAGGG